MRQAAFSFAEKYARVAKLVDAPDLGSDAERHVGSNPTSCTWPLARKESEMTQNIPAIDMVATGQRITDLRVAAGMSVRDLQDVFGFATPQAIYKWQHGTAMPTLDNLVVLAAVLGVAMDDIIVIEGEWLYSLSA